MTDDLPLIPSVTGTRRATIEYCEKRAPKSPAACTNSLSVCQRRRPSRRPAERPESPFPYRSPVPLSTSGYLAQFSCGRRFGVLSAAKDRERSSSAAPAPLSVVIVESHSGYSAPQLLELLFHPRDFVAQIP